MPLSGLGTRTRHTTNLQIQVSIYTSYTAGPNQTKQIYTTQPNSHASLLTPPYHQPVTHSSSTKTITSPLCLHHIISSAIKPIKSRTRNKYDPNSCFLTPNQSISPIPLAKHIPPQSKVGKLPIPLLRPESSALNLLLELFFLVE